MLLHARGTRAAEFAPTDMKRGPRARKVQPRGRPGA